MRGVDTLQQGLWALWYCCPAFASLLLFNSRAKHFFITDTSRVHLMHKIILITFMNPINFVLLTTKSNKNNNSNKIMTTIHNIIFLRLLFCHKFLVLADYVLDKLLLGSNEPYFKIQLIM